MNSNQSLNLNNQQKGNEWHMSQQNNQTQRPKDEKHPKPEPLAQKNQAEVSVDNPTQDQESNEGKHQRTDNTWNLVDLAKRFWNRVKGSQVEIPMDNPNQMIIGHTKPGGQELRDDSTNLADQQANVECLLNGTLASGRMQHQLAKAKIEGTKDWSRKFDTALHGTQNTYTNTPPQWNTTRSTIPQANDTPDTPQSSQIILRNQYPKMKPKYSSQDEQIKVSTRGCQLKKQQLWRPHLQASEENEREDLNRGNPQKHATTSENTYWPKGDQALLEDLKRPQKQTPKAEAPPLKEKPGSHRRNRHTFNAMHSREMNTNDTAPINNGALQHTNLKMDNAMARAKVPPSRNNQQTKREEEIDKADQIQDFRWNKGRKTQKMVNDLREKLSHPKSHKPRNKKPNNQHTKREPHKSHGRSQNKRNLKKNKTRCKCIDKLNLPISPAINMLGWNHSITQPNDKYEDMTQQSIPQESHSQLLEIEAEMQALNLNPEIPEESKSKPTQTNSPNTRQPKPNKGHKESNTTNEPQANKSPTTKVNQTAGIQASERYNMTHQDTPTPGETLPTYPQLPHPNELRNLYKSSSEQSLGKIDMLLNLYQTMFDQSHNMTLLSQLHAGSPFFMEIKRTLTANQTKMSEVLSEIAELSKKTQQFEEASYIYVPKFGKEDKIDMQAIAILPTFDPKDLDTTLSQFWQKISLYIESHGLTEKAAKVILHYCLQGEAFETLQMSKEKSIKEIINSLKDSFGGFPTKTDFEEQMNQFKRGRDESIKAAMNRYEYIINQLYKDEPDLSRTRELKCKEMVRKIAMAEALEHLERTETTHNELDFSYQDRLKFLSREEEILRKRQDPQVNSANLSTHYPNEEYTPYEADYESDSEEYHSSDEYPQDEPEQAYSPSHKLKPSSSLNNVNIDTPEIENEPNDTNETPEDSEEECLECTPNTLTPEACLNLLMQENVRLKEEIVAMKEFYENKNAQNVASSPSPSLNSLTREYERIRKRREYEQQLPPRFIEYNDQHYERNPEANQNPYDEYPDEENHEAHPDDEADTSDYEVEDYLDRPVTDEMVINSLMFEATQLVRELELRDILYPIQKN